MAGHDEGKDRPADCRARHRPAPPVLQPVECGPDDRGDHGERCHRDQQVQQDVAALRVRGRTEEDGASQRDGDHRVGAVAEHLVPDQLGQARFTRAVGLARADDLAGDDPSRAVGLGERRLGNGHGRAGWRLLRLLRGLGDVVVGRVAVRVQRRRRVLTWRRIGHTVGRRHGRRWLLRVRAGVLRRVLLRWVDGRRGRQRHVLARRVAGVPRPREPLARSIVLLPGHGPILPHDADA